MSQCSTKFTVGGNSGKCDGRTSSFRDHGNRMTTICIYGGRNDYSFKSGGNGSGGNNNYSSRSSSTNNGQILKEYTVEDCFSNCQYNPSFNTWMECGGISTPVEILGQNIDTAICIEKNKSTKKECINTCERRFKVNIKDYDYLFN
jgi:hypothetical protein